ncbi:MAG: ABC transporter ATP-binding protein [Deltaproteobacteria bacterium]|nr:ABC transporter ATP-binding protein [Deltaproteobacteria bacterium]
MIVRYRLLLIAGVVALIATDLMGMAIPWLIKGGIDAIIGKGGVSPSLIKYPLMIVGAALLQALLRYFWRMNIFGFSRRIERDLRGEVFAHLLKLPLAYFQHMKTGDLMSRLTNDMQSMRELMGFGSLAIIDTAVIITGSLSLMIAIDPVLTFWSLLCLPFISFSVRFFGNRIFQKSWDVQQHLSLLSTYVQENLSGIRVVQAYAQEENQIRGFQRLSAEYRRKNLWLATLWSVLWPLMRIFAGISAAIVLWLGGRKVMQGAMTLGEFAAFNGYLAMLTWPLIAVGHVVNQYQRGAAALSRIIEILDVPVAPGYRESELPTPTEPIRGDVEIRNLNFSYGDGHPPALRGISLKIPAGATCGIIGETGSGKSTLVHLLLRLFEPPPGAVFIDSTDVTTIPLPRLKAAIGFVSQDIFLFSDTIRENILFGYRDADREALEESARIAEILPSIRGFTRQFDTILGERGVRLSGGQKQRTALARAIVKNPPVLILDDAFSSLDTETEDDILNHLREFMSKRTTILISHRISTVKGADMILYMRKGEIIERGIHEELLNRRGAYYRLHQRQQLTREVDEMPRREGPR